MKLYALVFCLLPLIALAGSPQKTMSKVEYAHYTGAQHSWPRSEQPVAVAKVDHGMPIYDKLPDRAYEVVGTMSDEGEMAVKHVAQAGRLVGAEALLVVSDAAFKDAGITIQPHFFLHADVPDPKGPSTTGHLRQPDAIKSAGQPATVRVTKIDAILIRWKR